MPSIENFSPSPSPPVAPLIPLYTPAHGTPSYAYQAPSARPAPLPHTFTPSPSLPTQIELSP
ncbi:hypothetical protein K438DRAFT_1991256 [Mycena galopus ATCC 62051]|nr:hypothetical protein K438DRAFT_1991256 [Mycena galopus ATCC 62051]